MLNGNKPQQADKQVRYSGDGISVRGINVTYRNGHTALWDATFEIPRGSIAALVGVNGAGKSTLFKAIMGFVPVDGGKIRILNLASKLALKKNYVAYVPQSEDVDWNFPVLVEEVVMMGRYGRMGFLRRASKHDEEIVDKSLRRVGMDEYRTRQIGELSGGQRKRVFLARALAQDAQVILLDEPFAGVDVRTETQMIEILSELRKEGCVILISTHNLGTVPEFCDQSVLINQTVIGYGPTQQVFTRENLERTFEGVLRHLTIPAQTLHTDGDERNVTILTDDERPFVQYGGEVQTTDHDE